MPNIAQIRLRGFQSHTDSTINLGEGLNVITGPSDAGKTAIIRAVRWVAFGEPSGEAFVNESVGEAEVKVTLDDGISVTKTRRKGKTSYKLSTIDEPFDKAEVPEEVKQVLQIVKQSFGDFEAAMNFAYQLDAPFLISETASAGAKILGKLAGTEAVDGAIKSVSKDTHAARQEKSQAQKEIERIDTQLLGFHDLEDIAQQIDVCSGLIERIEGDCGRKDRLSSMQTSLEQAEAQIARAGEALDRLADLPALEVDLENIEKAQKRYDALLGLYSQWAQATESAERLARELASLEGLETAGMQIESLVTRTNRLNALGSLSTEYTGYSQEVKRLGGVLQQFDQVDAAGDILKYLPHEMSRLELLKRLDIDHRNLQDEIDGMEVALNYRAHLDDAAQILANVDEQERRLMTLRTLRTRLQLDSDDISLLESHLQKAERNVIGWQAELDKAWQDAGGICPLCESPITGGVIHGH